MTDSGEAVPPPAPEPPAHPRPEPATPPAPPVAPVPPAHQPRAVRRPGWLIALVVILALGLVASIGLSVWATVRAVAAPGSGGDRVAAGEQAVAKARTCLERIFSYDHRAYQKSVAAGLDCTTGKFRKDYRRTTRGMAAVVSKEKAIVRAKLSSIGVVEATSQRVEVLAFVNQRRRQTSLAHERLDQNRLVATMRLVDGEWLVSEVASI